MSDGLSQILSRQLGFALIVSQESNKNGVHYAQFLLDFDFRGRMCNRLEWSRVLLNYKIIISSVTSAV